MKWFAWWKTDISDEEVRGLEAKLLANMIFIPPRPDFVAGLRQSIMRQIPEEVELAISTQKKRVQTGLLVAGGIFGGFLMLVSGIRGLVSLVGAMTLLVNWIRQNPSLSPPSKNPLVD